jgi:hypothetical protein
MMKSIQSYRSKFFLAFLLPFFHMAYAQQFTLLDEGELVSTPSDSRSINLVDVNNDGADDVFITNGPSDGAPNFLYLNNGAGEFVAVYNDPIVNDTSAFDGATFADADNDGDLDAFVVTWYGLRNYFYRNQGDGTFLLEPENISGSFGTYSETAAWGDADLDGYVDIYVTNSAGTKKNLFFFNDASLGFDQVMDGDLVNDAYYSRGVNWVDYDNDGNPDLFVCNESNQKNNLYRNEGEGQFTMVEDVGPTTGQFGSMSSSWGDIDNDGDLDLFIANSEYFGEQNNQLFLNNDDGTFTEVADMEVVTDGGCSYSSGFADYDNDGDLDLFVTNGYCSGEIVNFLYRNDGSGYFERDLLALPNYSTPCSFGAAWSDLDNNGFQDLVVSTCKNSSSSPLPNNMVYINDGNENHWVRVKLEGGFSNRSALGARVYATAVINGSEVTQMREVGSQDGYCSQSSLTAHFGLGEAPGQVAISVHWPSGQVDEVVTNSDTTLFIEESPLSGSRATIQPAGTDVRVLIDGPSGKVTLRIENPSEERLHELTIVDLAGRQKAVFPLWVAERYREIDPGHGLDSGMYLACLKTERHFVVSKFIVP